MKISAVYDVSKFGTLILAPTVFVVYLEKNLKKAEILSNVFIVAAEDVQDNITIIFI